MRKTFQNTLNLITFNQYVNLKEMPANSADQYRCGAYALEDVLEGATFNHLTVDDLKEAITRKKTKETHMKNLIIDTFIMDLSSYSREVIEYCLDDRTKKVFNKLVEV